jgi:hypothetical protein
MNPVLLGWIALGVPLLVIGIWLLWRRYRPVFWMYLGALLVGLGYLTVTGALGDIGTTLAGLFLSAQPAK